MRREQLSRVFGNLEDPIWRIARSPKPLRSIRTAAITPRKGSYP